MTAQALVRTVRPAGPEVSATDVPTAVARVRVRVKTLRPQRVAIAVAMFGLPLLRPGGPGNTGLVDVGLLVVLGATAAWASWTHHQLRFPYVIPIGLLISAGAIAALKAEMGPLVLLTLGQDAYVLVWGAVLANLATEAALLRSATRSLAMSGVIWACVLLVGVAGHIDALAGITAREGSRASLTLGDPNLAANYFLVCLMVLRAAQFPRRRSLRWLCCGLIIAAVAFTGSNGGALTLTLATVLGAVLGLWRRRGPGVAFVAALVLGVGGAALVSQVSLTSIALKAQASAPVLRDSIGRQAESGSSRSSLADEGIGLWKTDGLIGVGPGQTKETLQARQAPYVKEAHDDYMAAFVERGVLGGAAVLLLVGSLMVRAQRVVGRPLLPRYQDVIPRPELLAAGVAAVLVSAGLYEILHFRHVWALFGILAGLDLWGRRE
jgi:O-antigen ligase